MVIILFEPSSTMFSKIFLHLNLLCFVLLLNNEIGSAMLQSDALEEVLSESHGLSTLRYYSWAD